MIEAEALKSLCAIVRNLSLKYVLHQLKIEFFDVFMFRKGSKIIHFVSYIKILMNYLIFLGFLNLLKVRLICNTKINDYIKMIDWHSLQEY